MDAKEKYRSEKKVMRWLTFGIAVAAFIMALISLIGVYELSGDVHWIEQQYDNFIERLMFGGMR